eukprot:scaffold123511_cov19-Tisochrysis_lutea.AAC.1
MHKMDILRRLLLPLIPAFQPVLSGQLQLGLLQAPARNKQQVLLASPWHADSVPLHLFAQLSRTH